MNKQMRVDARISLYKLTYSVKIFTKACIVFLIKKVKSPESIKTLLIGYTLVQNRY